MKLAAAALAFCALVAAVNANASERRTESTFAQATIGQFKLKAQTRLEWVVDEPYVESVDCHGDNEDIRFSVDGLGQLGLGITFRGAAQEDGDREEITRIGDRLWLFVDNMKFEFARIPTRDSRMLKFEYRPIEHDPDAVILPVWHGHSALRRNGVGPFVHFNRFNETIVNAKKLEWGFISRNWDDVGNHSANALPADWKVRRYPIDNSKLKEAIAWCSMQVASDAARTFPLADIPAD